MSIEASNEKVGTPMDSFCKTCTGFGFVQVYYAGRVVRVGKNTPAFTVT